jgi:superfamily II RNA helicase
VSLSATVSNAEEFGEWLVTVRGDTEVVVEEHRPVPLWQHVMVGTRLHDLFVGDDASGARATPATSTPSWCGWPARTSASAPGSVAPPGRSPGGASPAGST